MASPNEGTYILVNAATLSSPLTLYVAANGVADGSNVILGEYHNSTAQVFNIESYDFPEVGWDDGAFRIISRYCGKAVDIQAGNISSGTNVQIYHAWSDSLNARAQQWLFDKDGTVTFNGKTYDSWLIHPITGIMGDDDLCMGVQSTTAGANVVLVETGNNIASQHWVLYPVPLFQDGGVYSIRSGMDTSFCWTAGGKSNGANVSLAKYNGTNSQKWFVDLLQNGSMYLRAIGSGSAQDPVSIDVDAPDVSSAPGGNIRIADENLGRLQTWLPVAMGTKMVDGEERQVMHMKLYASTSGNEHLAAAVDWDGRRNVFCNYYTGDGYQTWVLVPEDAQDDNMPVPDIKGAANEAKGICYTDLADRTGSLTCYPGWSCTDAWATDGPNHYEYRLRRRWIRNSNWTWTNWTSWTQVAPAGVATSGRDAWLSKGVTFGYDPTVYAVEEVQFQVRTVSDDSDEDFRTGSVHSAWAAAQFRSIYKPNVSLGSTAACMPDGLMLTFSSNYAYTNIIHIDSIKANGVELLSSKVGKHEFTGTGSTILVPYDKLKSVPQDGVGLTVQFGTGTPGCVRFGDVPYQTGTTTVSYNGGTTTPTMTYGTTDGYRLTVTVPHLGKTGVFYIIDGKTVEAELLSRTGGNATYALVLPFGADTQVVAASRNSNGSSWYITDDTVRYEPANRAHVFNWDGGWAQVMLTEDERGIVTSHSLEGDYERFSLNSRDRETVTFGETMKGGFTVTGVSIGLVDHGSHDDIMALVKQHYATYRSPRGQMCEVAVLSAKTDEHKSMMNVDIELVEVSQ